MHTITWTVEDVDDEYDPSEPNNYELYLEVKASVLFVVICRMRGQLDKSALFYCIRRA